MTEISCKYPDGSCFDGSHWHTCVCGKSIHLNDRHYCMLTGWDIPKPWW
jgi:hypothetical protein